MENRNSVSTVRALREKFELQAEGIGSRSDLTKSGSQTKLNPQISSLRLNDSISSIYREVSPSSIILLKPHLSVQLPLPPSVLPTQILKPRSRPFSYSEATDSGGSTQSPPEKPPRTFLYDLLSDPLPSPPRPSVPPTYAEVFAARRKPLTISLSLPRSGQVDLEVEELKREGNQSVPSHRKAVYISDQVTLSTSNIGNKKFQVRPGSTPTTSDDNSRVDSEDEINSDDGSVPQCLSSGEFSLALSNEKIAQGRCPSPHRISLASIRPIQVVGSVSQDEILTPPPPRLLRAKTEPEIQFFPTQVPRNSTSRSLPGSNLGNQNDVPDKAHVKRQQFKNEYEYTVPSNSHFNSYYYPHGLPIGSGQVNRTPLRLDHPNYRCVGVLQNFQQFFGSEDAKNGNSNKGSNSAAKKYAEFISCYHPELGNNDEPSRFFRQGTSVTVVPPKMQPYQISNMCSHRPDSNKELSYRPYSNQNSSNLSYSYQDSGNYRKHSVPLIQPVRTFGSSTGKSKSDWNLNDTDKRGFMSLGVNNNSYNNCPDSYQKDRRASNQNFLTAKAVFNEQPQQQQHRQNGFRSPKVIHQSIHSLVNQIYPVSIEGIHGKDSSTDSGIQLGTDSLSSCDTPLGDSTTDTGDSDCENETEDLINSRQVVEERKGYIRRVSSIRATELLPLQRLLRNRPLPEPLPQIDHGKKHEEGSLFDNLLIIGIRRDEKTGAYHPIIKYKFPHTATLPDGIERFCFPDSLEWPCHEGSTAQFYTLTVTQSDGSRRYGCCYRILPDGANICIPIAYCIITQTRAIGFYRNVLQILASRHGYSESQMDFLINELYEESVPDPGKNLMFQDPISSLPTSSVDYGMGVPLILRRKADSRLENTDLHLFLNSLDLSTVLKLFGSLLLERKIILLSRSLNLLSLCVEALESMLYPFSWQHTFVPILPLNMNELLEVPAPFVIGVLRSEVVPWDVKLDEGIVVDLDQRKILSCVGDEGSILPKRFYKKLREALQSVLALFEQTENTKNVLISECFIRMFVETMGHYRTTALFDCSTLHPTYERKQSGDVRVFKKEIFLKAVSSKSNRDFLEWFCETSMFQQFIECRKKSDFKPGLFEQRCVEQLELNKDTNSQGFTGGNVPWKNTSILSKGTAWFKETFYKERD